MNLLTSNPETAIADYLKMIRDQYPNLQGTPFYRLIAEGKEFESAAIPMPKAALLKRIASARPFRLKQCYNNAIKIAAHCGFPYVEGLAVCELGFPISHAWNVVDGALLDVTWSKASGEMIYGRIPKGWHYYGVKLTSKQVWRFMELADKSAKTPLGFSGG